MSMEDYAQKKASFDQAARERQSLIEKLRTIVTALGTNPNGFHFANCEGGFPAEVVLVPGNPTFDANQWPSAQNIQRALIRWHEAKQQMEVAWNALPQDQRGAMQPPPTQQAPRRY